MLVARSSTARTRGSSVIIRLHTGQECAHLLRELAHANGLLQVAVEAGPEDTLAIVLHRERGDGDDGSGGGRGALPQLLEGLHAVDTGELEVQQHQIGRARTGEGEALLGGACLGRPESVELQYIADELQVPFIVLDDEDQLVGHAASASQRTRASRTISRDTGLTRYSVAPRASPLARSSRIDTTITGMGAVTGSAFRDSRTCQPSSPGSRMSRTTVAGCRRLINSIPRSPSRALTTRSPTASKWTVSRSTERRSSSMTTTVRPPPELSGPAAPASVAVTGAPAGMANPKVLPTPTSLSTQIRPPCNSTIRLDRVSPRLVPSVEGAVRPPCWKASKIRSRSSAATPTPVSETVTSTSLGSARARTSMRPPSGVNFTAFDSRLTITCLTRSSSACTCPTPGATSR